MTKQYLLAFITPLFLVGCGGGAVEPTTSPTANACLIATYKVASSDNESFAQEVTFAYDEQKRLVKSSDNEYTYTGDKLLIKSPAATTTAKLNSFGYVTESVYSASDSKGTTYTYDASGYLMRYETDGTGSSVKKYIYEFTYQNGDLSERKYSVMEQSGVIRLIDRATYEYYTQSTDKLNVGNLQVLNYSVPNGGPSLTGKPNQHLVKKQTVIGGQAATYEYQYVYDTNGLVKKAVVWLSSQGADYKRYYWFTYKCSK